MYYKGIYVYYMLSVSLICIAVSDGFTEEGDKVIDGDKESDDGNNNNNNKEEEYISDESMEKDTTEG